MECPISSMPPSARTVKSHGPQEIPQHANRREGRITTSPVAQVFAERSRCLPSGGLSERRTVRHRQVFVVKGAIELIDRVLVIIELRAPLYGFAATRA